jgi:RHS repeat-associated protein
MAMSVVYGNFLGGIVTETRGGVERDYVPDPLGSTAHLVDATGTLTDSFEYWPYGEVRTRTGTTPTPFGYVGTLGYYTDQLGRLYVRARHYLTLVARWLTVDPLWPRFQAYEYAEGDPGRWVDPDGLQYQNPMNFFGWPHGCKFPALTTPTMPPCVKKVMDRTAKMFEKMNFDVNRPNSHNAVAHCTVSCEIQRACGSKGAAAWQSREDLNESGVCAVTPRSCKMDARNNSVGFSVASKKGGCFNLCLQNFSKLVLD